MAPAYSSSFSVSVVLPASGCEMIANVRRRATSRASSAGFGTAFIIVGLPRMSGRAGEKKTAGAAAGGNVDYTVRALSERLHADQRPMQQQRERERCDDPDHDGDRIAREQAGGILRAGRPIAGAASHEEHDRPDEERAEEHDVGEATVRQQMPERP